MATSSFSKGINIETDEAADALLQAHEASKKAKPIPHIDVEASLQKGAEMWNRRSSP